MIKERSLQQYKRMLRKNSQKLSELMSTYEMIIFRLREGRM